MNNKRFNEIIKESIDYVVNSAIPTFVKPNTTYDYSTANDEEELNDSNSLVLSYNDGTVKKCNIKYIHAFNSGHDHMIINMLDGAIFYHYMGKNIEVSEKEHNRIVKKMRWWVEEYKGEEYKGYVEEVAKILKYAEKYNR